MARSSRREFAAMSEKHREKNESAVGPPPSGSAGWRPASWLEAGEIRRRARRRNAAYIAVAAGGLLLFVLLIHLLLEKTRGSAGSSPAAMVAAPR